MTREEAKKLLPIIQGYANGGTVEKWSINRWFEVDEPKFIDKPSQYRIKPEPKYRPFKNQEECWNEMLKHQPFGWIRSIDTKRLRNINSIGYTTYGIGIDNSIMYFDTALNAYAFADGTPFGIKEE